MVLLLGGLAIALRRIAVPWVALAVGYAGAMTADWVIVSAVLGGSPGAAFVSAAQRALVTAPIFTAVALLPKPFRAGSRRDGGRGSGRMRVP